MSASGDLQNANLQGAAELSMAYADARVSDDPDAPIRTGRFDLPAQAPVQLAGAPFDAPRIAEAAPAARSDPGAITLAKVAPTPQTSPAAAGGRTAFAQAAIRQAAFQSKEASSGARRSPRLALSLTTDESPLSPESGLAFQARDLRENLAAPRIQPRSKLFDARRLGLQLDLSPENARKGRWFAFAASSGDALGFNLFGDPAKSGRKRNSWSVEKLAEYGKMQIGIGWRKGPMQMSVAATQREIGAYGFSREDTVLGVSFTISGGKRLAAPKARRGIPRD
jgi:hypothetical protein